MEKRSIENSINTPEETSDPTSEATPSLKEDRKEIFIEGTPSQAKAEFFQSLENRITYLNRDEYRQRFGNEGPAHFDGIVYSTDTGKKVENPAIYINIDEFIGGGKDYSDLIPIVVRHEAAEFWTYAKTGYSFSPAPASIGKGRRVAFAHGLALRKEYEYAFEIGKADRYLEFIINRYGDNRAVAKENIKAYDLVKRRREHKLKFNEQTKSPQQGL